MTKSQQISFAQLVFAQLMRMDETKLQRGLNRRQTMLAATKAGIVPTGPRVEWLRASTSKIMHVLIEQAEKFNENNNDDLVSVQDMIDILNSAARLIKKQSGIK